MYARARRLAVPGAFALVATLLIAWDGMLTVSFTDYENEAEPSFQALRLGHLGAFLAHLPAYGGSLILRSPFALTPNLWGGGALALFRSVAAPCLAAAVVLGLVLWSRLSPRSRGARGTRAAWLALALCTLNPITLRALEIGHPEELLGACLCVGAVLAALDGRAGLSGAFLGLALANKPWAVAAVVPVAVALPTGHRRAAAVAAASAAGLLAPMLLSGSAASTGAIATHTGAIFQPWQLWWFLGSHGHVVHGLYGVKPGYRAAPGWLSGIGHPLAALVPLAVGALWWRRRRGQLAGSARADALLALALALLVRCLLDPWDTVYYSLPFLLALAAWEAWARGRGPLTAAAASLGAWTVFELVPRHAGPDGQSLAFLAWALPLTVGLGWRLYAPDTFAVRWRQMSVACGQRLPTLARAVAGHAPAADAGSA